MLNLTVEDDRFFQVKGVWKGLLNTWQYWPPGQWPFLCRKKNSWAFCCMWVQLYREWNLSILTMLDWLTMEESSIEITPWPSKLYMAINCTQKKTCNASKTEAFQCRNLLMSENSQQSMQGICNWMSVWGVAQNPIRHMYMLYNVFIRSGFVSWPGTQHQLCSWARHFTLIVPVCTHVFKMGTGKFISWGTLWCTRIKSGGGRSNSVVLNTPRQGIL